MEPFREDVPSVVDVVEIEDSVLLRGLDGDLPGGVEESGGVDGGDIGRAPSKLLFGIPFVCNIGLEEGESLFVIFIKSLPIHFKKVTCRNINVILL